MDYIFLGPEHITSMLIILAVWVITPLWGLKLNQWQIQFVATLLAVLTISVELFDDVYRFQDGHWLLIRDLPLHICGFATFLSAYALYTRNQMSFELAFFWGMGGALQAILTPDMSRFYSPYYFYISQISHAIIILNVLWMLTVFKLKIGKYAIHRTVLLTLFLMIFISIFNYFISSNYFFLCEKPGGFSPFLVGEWPVYVIFLIFFGIAIMWILDVLVKRVQRFI
jgi:hypothetical integral membrane protein (TIGR02206 family)